MKNSKLIKKLGALVLSGVVLVGTALPVFAAENGIVKGEEANPAKLEITKKLEFNEGLAIPEKGFEFGFEITPIDGAPEATVGNIKFDKGDENGKNVENGKKIISKTAKVNFNKFPHAGVYKYTIKEKKVV